MLGLDSCSWNTPGEAIRAGAGFRVQYFQLLLPQKSQKCIIQGFDSTSWATRFAFLLSHRSLNNFNTAL